MQLMGKVQLEVLQERIRERFGIAVAFGPGSIVYKETIAAPVEGVGHFEPLQPLCRGTSSAGAVGAGKRRRVRLPGCSEDMLDKNWQRLVLTHLAGTGAFRSAHRFAPITDMKITADRPDGHTCQTH